MDLVRSWWDWCIESFGHMFLGVTAPILLIGAFVVLIGASGSGSLPQPPRSDVAGVCLDATSGACVTPGAGGSGPLVIDTAIPVPPTPTPAPRTYVVQSGDALSLICANEVPEMAVDKCIAETVAMSDLGGPNEIVAGQELFLPGVADPNAMPRPRPTATPEPATTEPETEEVVQSEETPPDEGSEAEEEDGDSSSEALDGEPAEAGEEGEESDTEAVAEASAQGTPEALFVPLLSQAEPDPEETAPADLDIDAASLYTVEPGDSVLSICVEQVPDMDPDECVQFVVLLNELEGPDEIYANQGLLLP